MLFLKTDVIDKMSDKIFPDSKEAKVKKMVWCGGN